MKSFKELRIPGVYLVDNFRAKDERGIFVKTFHKDSSKEIGFNEEFKESFYSQSVKDVIRGMHFQAPPFDHNKLVYVTAGKILDVILDIRSSSPTFGKAVSVELDEFGSSVLIPKGCAHGFLTLSEKLPWFIMFRRYIM
jgi:dTDP-4-dehydrorhamnose 3,5-epimerase